MFIWNDDQDHGRVVHTGMCETKRNPVCVLQGDHRDKCPINDIYEDTTPSVAEHRSDCKIFTRNTSNSGQLNYIVSEEPLSFNQTILWCQQLNGNLPIIHSQEEFDFLMTKVVEKNSHPPASWIGRKSVSRDVCSPYWLDGTRVAFPFNTFSLAGVMDSRCVDCIEKECCAMYLWNDHDHGEAGFTSCDRDMRAICVVKGELIEDFDCMNIHPSDHNLFHDHVFPDHVFPDEQMNHIQGQPFVLHPWPQQEVKVVMTPSSLVANTLMSLASIVILLFGAVKVMKWLKRKRISRLATQPVRFKGDTQTQILINAEETASVYDVKLTSRV